MKVMDDIGLVADNGFQFVHMNDVSSLPSRFTCGVPQGFVLGPIILLYTCL